MSATAEQKERRQQLHRRYQSGMPAGEACRQLGLNEHTGYYWYHKWSAEDGDNAPCCGCGRPVIHKGRCSMRTRKPHNRWIDVPVYDGPDMIGKPFTPEETYKVRRCAERLSLV